jgi:oxaloacetate decarboxylase alpha subunit
MSMSENKPLGITEVVLRDAHQSLFATRLRLDDMLPIAEKLDQIGYWSIESWGGATFDSCIRFLGEDPWERIRKLKEVMPRTPQQMLFRGQNILGYRHYADDLVSKFVERATVNGIEVFRIFDAMNDPRNLETAIRAVNKVGMHAQGAMSYTVSSVHTLESWMGLAQNIESAGADSLCIKDMAGLLTPYAAYELVSKLKQTVTIPIHLHCHATTGLSTTTCIKAMEAGVDNVDTSSSSMSITYVHSATESMIAIMAEHPRSTGLDITPVEEVAAYFREVRKKYAEFEGALKGIDSRILIAQVPGGMLTNLENQLRKQNASDKLDEVLLEIPRVREDLGFIPLVTPTSQIVGTQAVLNVLTGERYQTITKETEGVLKGEYGATPAPVNKELQVTVLDGAEPITCRPADLLEPEFDSLTAELKELADKEGLKLAENVEDDVLTYALFPQVSLKFLANRDNPDAFEPRPEVKPAAPVQVEKIPVSKSSSDTGVYTVEVEGQSYVVKVTTGGDVASVNQPAPVPAVTPQVPANDAVKITAPLAGNVFKLVVAVGDKVESGTVVIVLEAMKMETEIRSTGSGTVAEIPVQVGDAVAAGDTLVILN